MVVLAAALALATTVVDATCKSAPASESRINLQLCLSQLCHHREIEPRRRHLGLAKVASVDGANSADLAADDIKVLEANHPLPALVDPVRQALRRRAGRDQQAGLRRR